MDVPRWVVLGGSLAACAASAALGSSGPGRPEPEPEPEPEGGGCTVRLTYLGQKANQGQLLRLPPSPSTPTRIPTAAVTALLAKEAAEGGGGADLERWRPLWYDVSSKGWRDMDSEPAALPRPASSTLDVRLVDRSAPGGCTPEGHLPPPPEPQQPAAARVAGQSAPRRGTRGWVRRSGSAEAEGATGAETDDQWGYFAIGVVGLKTEANLGDSDRLQTRPVLLRILVAGARSLTRLGAASQARCGARPGS